MDTIQQFHVDIDPSIVEEFQSRLNNSRWFDSIEGSAEWSYGTSGKYLKEVCEYVSSGEFNFNQIQEKLNAVCQYTANVPNERGTVHRNKKVHYIHEKSFNDDGSEGIPLLLLHGWPSTPFNFVQIIPLLVNSGFTVIAPSIPGYGFSEPPTESGFGVNECAHLFQSLMVDVLGYSNGYVVQGGDWGSIIGRSLSVHYSNHVLAYHTNMPLPLPSPPTTSMLGEGARYVSTILLMALNSFLPQMTLSKVEQNGLNVSKEYGKTGSAYMQLQGTKPDTLGYGLNDSPLGLLSWIAEKNHAWSDSSYDNVTSGSSKSGSGNNTMPISMEHLLTTAMVFWSTNTITS
jgi:epoxide hydrolase